VKSFTLDVNLEFTSATGSDKQIRNKQIDELMMKQLSYKQSLQDAIKEQFKQFVASLVVFDKEFYSLSDSVSKIDVLYHKAKLAIQHNYCQPTINDKSSNSFVDAKQMRHVLIEQFQNDELYVPNDVMLGCDGTSTNTDEGMLLFGTNAVGKSSLIKSLGICVIMAQSGFYVPCSSFHYKPFKQLFTRILGNDNIFKGLSTFAVEMSELNTILRYSTEDSLVLGDELCYGTELGSAISIFCAGLMQLSNIHSKFIFATHFHEITNMRQITDISTLTMKHMAVIYDAKDDCLVYDRRLMDGPGNNNYGLEVCKSLNLPRDFLELANSIRLQQQPETKPVSMRKKSSYNAKKLRTNCEVCNKECVEVHHLQHQKEANEKGFIQHFHKNHKANLINVCESCHSKFHNSNKQHKRVKTTKGLKVRELT
jgi:DNA mismatch repair protein MutS